MEICAYAILMWLSLIFRYYRPCALRWLYVISPMTCSQSANQMRVCMCLRGCNPLNKLSITDWRRGVCLLPRHMAYAHNAMCETEFTCSSRVHVKAIMTNYQDLLQTIKSLQHSRLSYIELLQEEVKRNQNVS